MGHPMTTDSANINRQKNANKSQRLDKIKRGATPPTSRHRVAPHLLLLQRTGHNRKSTTNINFTIYNLLDL